MDRRQKAILIEVATVLVVTLTAVVAMINFKDYINRSESIGAMRRLGELVVKYQRQNGRVPSEQVIRSEMDNIKGGVRLTHLVYRGLWIDFEAEPNEVLAYCKKNYPASLLDDGYVVLTFDANTVWMGKEEFEELLAQQQSEAEIETMNRESAR